MEPSRDRMLGNDAGDARVLLSASDAEVRIAVVQHGLAQEWSSALAKQVLNSRAARPTATATAAIAASTWAAYQRTLRLWIRYLDDEAKSDDPGPATVGAYLAWLRRTRPRLAISTLNNRLDTIQAFYRWTAKAGLFPDIAGAIPATTDPRCTPLAVLGSADVRRLVARLGGQGVRALRDRALIWTLFGGALETISAHRANVADFDAAAGTLRHRPRGHRIADVTTILPAPAITALRRYLERRQASGAEPLFTPSRRRTPQRLSTLSMRLTVRRCLDVDQARSPTRRGVRPRGLAPSALRVSGLCHRLGWSAQSTQPVDTGKLLTAVQSVGHRSLRAASNLIRRCRPL
jgi:site-specific recombinase XerD